MKSVLYIVAMFSFALVACTQRIPDAQMPDVDNGVITMVKATVNPLHLEGETEVGNYMWQEDTNLGIYGSAGVNEHYRVVKSTTGNCEAYFYGNAVAGETLTIYMPYSSEGGENALEGRVQICKEQKYYASALDHLMYNSAFLATTTTNEVVFDYYAGIVKLVLKCDVGNIDYVSVRAATVDKDKAYNDFVAGYLPLVGYEGGVASEHGFEKVYVRDFPENLSSSVDEPLTMWVALAPGIYDNLVVEIYDKAGELATFPVKGVFEVKRCAIAEKVCEVVREEHDNGVDDFVGEDGTWN